ncbi:hypothetical protein COY05_02835 [Candidatus Peregrinibacteria bacterium CG_4_10_14_0_2_um_filter_38_24]|nr:MAG: hypothetical protein COY05_02835 [Candidatus Peregrinibacteria bacterium CG_4_10_14_0_2_um_filter_38_24]
MEINVATICDAASVTDGKLSVLGAFDTIYVNSVPVLHPNCSLAFQVLLDGKDDEEHDFIVKIMDEDGNEAIGDIALKLVAKKNKARKFEQINIALNIQNLKLEKLGYYKIELLENNEVIKTIHFLVQKTLPKEK